MRTRTEAATWAPCIIEPQKAELGYMPIRKSEQSAASGWEAVAETPHLNFCEAIKLAREYAERAILLQDPEVRDMVFVGSEEALWKVTLP